METDEFPFPTSQSTDDTVREATLVATLAESFSLTHFKGFQKDTSSQQHLRDVTQLCFNLHKSIQDQVTNLREKGIPAIFLGSAQFDRTGRILCFTRKRGGKNHLCYT